MKTLNVPVLLPRLLDRVEDWFQPVPVDEDRVNPQSKTPSQGEMIWLRRGQVTSIGEGFAGKLLRVTNGTVWLTDTPATGDYVLEAGDVWLLSSGCPWVVQALDEAMLVLEER